MTSTPDEPMIEVPLLHAVLEPYRDTARMTGGAASVNWDALEAALIQREDLIGDFLRMAGQRFGLFPQIVAEVLAETGLGTTPTPEVREMIHRQFHELMAQIAAAMRGDGPMPNP